jgi:uncharacterized protein
MCRLNCVNSVLGMTTTTNATPRIRSFAGRLAVMLPVTAGVMTLGGLTTSAVAGSAVASLVVGPALAVLALLVYRMMIRFTERRAAVELAGVRRYLPPGALAGAGLIAASIAGIALLGGYSVVGWGSFGGFLATLGMMSAVAVCEEIVFRGVVFRLVEEKIGTYGALGVSAVLFGVVHLVNPGATAAGTIGVAVEAGLLLGAAYVATRSLWLPIGLHLGWNVAQGGIFGATVSGSDSTPTGLLRSILDGPELVTGGTFGPEASLVTVLVGVVAAALLLRRARRAGRVVARTR